MDLGLSNKTAVVTGGGSGIGKAVCFLLAQEGARVAVVDLRGDPANVVAETIRKQNGKALGLAADASAAADVNRVVAKVSEEYGGIDILVNNAGIILQAPAIDTTEPQWDKSLATISRVASCARRPRPSR